MIEYWKDWIAGENAGNLIALDFQFNTPLGTAACLLALLLLGAVVVVYYWPQLDRVKFLPRLFLVGLRMAFFTLALFLLLDPCLVGQRIQPGDQYVVLLFDDSKSMRVKGEDGRSRGERLQEAYSLADSEFEETLRAGHQVLKYRFGDGTEPLNHVQDLDFSQSKTDIPLAIGEAMRELDGFTLSAVVLFSDGVQQTSRALNNLKEELKTEVPVFTVGTGAESSWRDLRISQFSVKRPPFDRSPVSLHCEIESVGLAGETALVEALDGHKVVAAKTLVIDSDRQINSTRLEFIPEKKGWLNYELRTRLSQENLPDSSSGDDENVQTGLERLVQNNTRRFLGDNREKTFRILYYSGKPNWEHTFIRRALREDEELKLSSLILISRAERKFVYRGARTTMTNPLFEGFEDDQEKYGRYDEPVFLRLGLKEKELEDGYPKQAEDLFPYHLVIWGEVEPDDFNAQQLKLTRDFIDRRGGSLLLMGGRGAFTKEPYINSPIESALPVMPYESSDRNDDEARELFQTVPTLDGETSGAWTLDADPEENQRLWEEMPSLFGLNRFILTRAGAAAHARAVSLNPDLNGQPVYAVQRYGRGRCAVLATGETWPWRMKLDIENDNHIRFWRQLIRSLVKDVPEPLQLRSKQDSYTVGEPARFEIAIRDALFEEREGLQAAVSITTSSQQKISLSVDESITEPGVYTCEWIPEEEGIHTLSVIAKDENDENAGTLEEAFLTELDRKEYQKAEYNPAFLRELANVSGGKFYTLEQLGEIAKDIPYTPNPEAETIRLHLWHHPGFYILLIVLMTLEWFLRRKRGHA